MRTSAARLPDLPPAVLAHLLHGGVEDAGSREAYDCSRGSIEGRWRSGLEAGRAMIAALVAAPEPSSADGPLTVLRFPGEGKPEEAARRAA